MIVRHTFNVDTKAIGIEKKDVKHNRQCESCGRWFSEKGITQIDGKDSKWCFDCFFSMCCE